MSPNYLFLFFSVASAQSLLDIGSLRPDLSLFFSYVNASPSLKLQFAAADNFTLLAPTNEAVLLFLDTTPSPSLIDATASYHLLQGAHSSASVNASGTVFVSNLNDTAFVNITQGQSVKAFNNGTFFVESWLKAKTNVVSADIVVDGGLIHIVDSVLTIPEDAFQALPLANISIAVSILSSGNFLSVKNLAFTNSITFHPDTTILMPNSTLAQLDFKPAGRTQESLNRQFAYHCINGLVYEDDFMNGTVLPTLAGIELTVTRDENGEVFVNDAKVTSTDFLVNNGVMHILDDTLNPDNITIHTPSPKPPFRFTTSSIIEIAVGAAGLVSLIVGTAFLVAYRRRRRLSSPSTQVLPTVERAQSTTEIPLKAEVGDWESTTKTMEREELESSGNDPSVRELDWKRGHRKTQVPQLDADREPVEMPAEVPSMHVFEKGHDMDE